MMKLIKLLFRSSQKKADKPSDPLLHRLLLLENGVINYGGGIFRLKSEVCKCLNRSHNTDPEITDVLKNVEGYLSGLIQLAELEDLEEYLIQIRISSSRR